MMTRLAEERIRIKLGDTVVELVPTLRAALCLARRYGTYGALIDKLAEGSTTAFADAIEAGAGIAGAGDLIHAQADSDGYFAVIARLAPPLIDFVISLAGPMSDDKGDDRTTGEPITFAEHHEQLFEFATGWLRWTPAEAWAATPAEIKTAKRGHEAMLRWLYGGEEAQTQKTKGKGAISDRIRGFFARQPA
ncbi:phage tail assembly chaperone [Jiella avicenniae]|uniref:Phage tail assembly chaperone n=1 Tax=Jiella avicenniae TaxID=2907202 RepID=A0A9X1P4D7_9HYPH|nr:phage tail assembly chaperone [Jiella avicenniae]MCE7029539.1 phage tail assembly chaperone [Jiella avicenniae]